MDLPTHVVFGVAIGFVFFSRLDIALLIGIGALLPDLDREYWFIRFIKLQKNREEQLHRALFHNVFIIAFIYFFVPFISLGILLHMLLDSFTTYKDRGCEWFYPVSRFVKRGLKDGQGNDQPLDSIEHIYFYQEDPNGVDNIELDLKETGPVPWRRIYGPALNSHLLDRGFLFGSIAIILIWLFVPDSTHLNMILNQQSTPILLFGYFSLAVLFIAGEFDRGDKPLRLKGINFVKYPIFVVGIALLIYWLYLIRSQLLANFEIILANGASIVLGCIIVIVISFAVIKWQTRSGKNAII